MIASLVATALLAFQEPADPKVILPAGWKYGHAARADHTALVGPKGQEIGIPDYFSTGKVAEVTVEMDRKALFVTAVLRGHRVDVAITPQGFLAVSFDRGPNQSEAPFDFWRRVKDAREIAETLSIVLTRIDPVVNGTSPSAGASIDPTSDLIYRRYTSEVNPAKIDGNPAFWLRSPTGLKVELRTDLPTGAARTDFKRVLGGTLALAEAKGIVAIAYMPGGARVPGRTVAVARKGDLQASTLAMLWSMTRRAPQD